MNMKVIGSIMAVVLILAAACSKEETAPVPNPGVNGRISYLMVRDPSLILKVKTWQQSHENLAAPDKSTWMANKPDFTYDELALAWVNGEKGRVIVANQTGFDRNNDVNYGMAYFMDDDEIIGSLMVKMERTASETLRVSYYNLEERAALCVAFDIRSQTIRAGITDDNGMQKSTGEVDGWGKNTMACLADAYTNHGAISVWATVQTAFIPQTAAALAIACGIKNL
jgi:hypothetical protein